MNKSVTSRAELISVAEALMYSRGLSEVNIRAVAAKCGVSVGSIYNYFPTKADLIAAVIENFWRQTAHREGCAPRLDEPFPAYVGRLYAELARDLAAFQSGLLAQISALGDQERQKGRALEAKCFDHIKAGLRAALEQGRPPRRPPEDPDAFADFTFRYLMALLRENRPDCAYFQQVLSALLDP